MKMRRDPLDGRQTGQPNLSVMMPAFNEERTIELILKHVLARREVGEVLVVDDGSTDGTWDILTRFSARDRRVRTFRQETNQGKGAALRRAIGELRMPFALVLRDALLRALWVAAWLSNDFVWRGNAMTLHAAAAEESSEPIGR